MILFCSDRNRLLTRLICLRKILESINSGSYGWDDSLTIERLIEKSGGLTPEAYLDHAILFRKNSDLSTSSIEIDLLSDLDFILECFQPSVFLDKNSLVYFII